MKQLIVLCCYFHCIVTFAQVGIGTTTPNAVLDIVASNQANPSNTDGVLIPKIDAFPPVNPGVNQQGMLVYLTTVSNGKSAGFYYWDNTTISWVSIINKVILEDVDADTKIQVEETSDEDMIRFDIAGTERASLTDDTSDISTIAGVSNPTGLLKLEGYGLHIEPAPNATAIQLINIEGELPGNVYPYARVDFSNTDSGTLYQGASIRSHNDGATNDGDLRFFTADNTALTEQIRITSTGNMGVGETNPQEKLHVTGNIRMEDGNQADGYVMTSDANGTASWEHWSALQDIDTDTKIQVEETSDEDVIRFDIAGTERASLTDDTSDISIIAGVSNPTGLLKLEGYGLHIEPAPNATAIQLINIEGELPGNVYPYARVDFSNTDSGTLYQGASIRSHNDGSANDGDLHFFTADNTALTEQMRVTSTGNMGVGETNPQEKLHVTGNIRMEDGNQADGYVMTSDANGTASWAAAQDNQNITGSTLTGTNLTIGIEDGTSETINLSSLVNDADASTTNELNTALVLNGTDLELTDAGGTITADLSSINGADSLGNHTATQNLELANNYLSNDGDNEGLYIDATGNVGVNNNMPTVAFDVIGDIEYTGTITDVSDVRLKENIKSIDNALSKIKQINGVSYHMKSDINKQLEYGVIAQEVQKVFPNMVRNINGESDYLGVSYIQLIPVLLEAIKGQQTQIDTMTKENEKLKINYRLLEEKMNEIESLKKEIQIIKEQIQSLK